MAMPKKVRKPAHDDAAEIGKRIAALRIAKGMTQTEVAVILRRGTARISEWETGRVTPSIASVREIAEALGVSPHQIVTGNAMPVASGVPAVTNEQLRRVLDEPEWAKLPVSKRALVIQLLNDLDVDDYEIKGILASLMRATNKRRTR